MKTSNILSLASLLAGTMLGGLACERATRGLRPFPLPTDPGVFGDTFGANVDFQAFLGSKFDAVSIDPNERHSGSASLRVTVPNPGDPTGGYAGGAFTTNVPRDLTGYNALTFWAKASRAATLDVAGLGNDNTGTSRYEAKWSGIPLTTAWTRYVVPIPLPGKLTSERGLFFLAEGPEGGAGYTIWFDDVRFESVGTISNPRPAIDTRTVSSFVGGRVTIQGTRTVFEVGGTDRTVAHLPGYFTFASSNPDVAVVDGETIRVVEGGSAVITAMLGTVGATGMVTVNAIGLPSQPAPTPTVPAADVVSLFSNAYSDVPVDTWSAPWDQADVTDLRISGNDTKGYSNLVFAGIEFASRTIDASAMTHFHLDVYIPSGVAFKIKLVDFGANGVFGGGDDREHELRFDASTTPSVTPGTWSPLEIPLADFTNLTTRAHVAQLILSGASTAFVDNVYFHK